MRTVIVCALLAGCAVTPPIFDTAGKDPACSRQCLSSYSTCISGIGQTDNRLISSDVMRSCEAITNTCLSTCRN